MIVKVVTAGGAKALLPKLISHDPISSLRSKPVLKKVPDCQKTRDQSFVVAQHLTDLATLVDDPFGNPS